MENLQGTIIKGIGGFYYVKSAENVYECKARGIFRKEKVTPLVGDLVEISLQNEGKGAIEKIFPRKNSLVRPPVANIDRLFVLVSVREPVPNLLVIDKILATAENKNIEPILVFTKTDLQTAEPLMQIYEKAGIPCVEVSSVTGDGVGKIRKYLKNYTSAFTGNSGVGKSTLLNLVESAFSLETGEISTKLGRGRHTTRHVELLPLSFGGYVADTPGFAAIALERYEIVKKEDLPYCFPEFRPYLNNCRFTSCSHTCENGCAVLQAVQEGKIASSRHQSYKAMYQEVKDIKQWQMK